MKKLIFAIVGLCAAVMTALAGDEEITVKVSVEGTNNSALKKQCDIQGKKAAVKKYLEKMGNSKITEKVIDEAMSAYTKFVEDIEADESEYEDGALTCSYTVTIKQTDLAEWLKNEGIDLNAAADGSSLEIFVMEEPPDAGQLQLGDKMGSFFFNKYGEFQKTIRDGLVAEANKWGFKIILLEDNENYEEFKKKDPNLVGVSYNVNGDTRGFMVTDGFLRAVQENNPDAIVMYYRIDSLTYNPQSKSVRSSLALNLKNLADNSTRALGNIKGYELKASGNQEDEIMTDFSKCVMAALDELMDQKGVGKKITAEIKSMRNAAARPKGPMKLVINCSKVDSKIKIKVRNGLKKALVSNGLTKQTKVVKDSLSCVVEPNKDFGDLDDVWGKVSEILPEFLGEDIEITDEWAKKNGDTLTVTIGK